MTAVLSSAPGDYWNFDRTANALKITGAWIGQAMPVLEPSMEALVATIADQRQGDQVKIDLSAVESLDTFGAVLLIQLQNTLETRKVKAQLDQVPGHLQELLDRVVAVAAGVKPCPPTTNPVRATIERVGQGSKAVAAEALALIEMLGMVCRALAGVIRNPGRLRWHATVQQMEATGINALPIVGLLSLLIGMVLAYLSAVQLKNFGAEILVVNIIGLAVLREIGVLLAAIILAGRSGSAFTAQIGTMKVNQEVDAMQTMGLDVIEVLVLPRIMALVITLPLVGFYAAMAGLLGGGLAGYLLLDISPSVFLEQLQTAVTANDLIVTLIKAPVFAFAIALVGCFQGLKVTGSAQSVGQMTTRSVVVSICLVIILDAFFAILFQAVGL
ncbi:MAG: MlaE family lipid ABC transporter permease subunit [Pseudomonadota bacterium]